MNPSELERTEQENGAEPRKRGRPAKAERRRNYKADFEGLQRNAWTTRSLLEVALQAESLEEAKRLVGKALEYLKG